MQYLYLIEDGSGYFKIGVANDVPSRMASLQTGNPRQLRLLFCYGYENAEFVERAVHQKFDKLRAVGEWFLLSPKDIEEFNSICAMLGGVLESTKQNEVSEENLEEAEEMTEYTPTLDDVSRIIDDNKYRLELRYTDKGLRGFAWRLRSTGRDNVLYIGKHSDIFEQVKQILEAKNKIEKT